MCCHAVLASLSFHCILISPSLLFSYFLTISLIFFCCPLFSASFFSLCLSLARSRSRFGHRHSRTCIMIMVMRISSDCDYCCCTVLRSCCYHVRSRAVHCDRRPKKPSPQPEPCSPPISGDLSLAGALPPPPPLATRQ